MELTHDQRVQRGIAILDGLGPEGWRDRVDLDDLEIASGYRCILGQVYGEYFLAPKKLHGMMYPVHYGFHTSFAMDARAVEELNAAWRKALS